MIDVDHITKRYGDRVAVEDLTFQVKPGIVTGFLGPNGAGKSTTMRIILGLDRPNSGNSTVNGRAYRDLPAPLHEIGAMLEARAIHTGRSAYHHLVAMAQTHGIGRKRVQEVIDVVGLGEVAHKRAGGFSLGMGQRLGIAAALLVQLRCGDQPLHEAHGRDGGERQRAVAPAQRQRRAEADAEDDHVGVAQTTLGGQPDEAQRRHGERDQDVRRELTPQRASLEQAFMRLTGSSVEYQAGLFGEADGDAQPVPQAA